MLCSVAVFESQTKIFDLFRIQVAGNTVKRLDWIEFILCGIVFVSVCVMYTTSHNDFEALCTLAEQCVDLINKHRYNLTTIQCRKIIRILSGIFLLDRTNLKSFEDELDGISGDLSQNDADGNLHFKYQCSFCNKVCVRPSDLKIHERIHTGEKPYHCSLCEMRFTTTSNLNRHQRMHEKNGVKPISTTNTENDRLANAYDEIEIISNVLKSDEDPIIVLQLDNTGVTKSEPIDNSFCDLDTKDETEQMKSYLSSDLDFENTDYDMNCEEVSNEHDLNAFDCTNVNTFECYLCKMTVAHLELLENHMNSHLNSSNGCYRSSFKSNKSLNNHKLKRIQRSPFQETRRKSVEVGAHGRYQCAHCNVSYKYLKILKKHELTHSTPKSFECVLCRQTFQQSSVLSEHQRKHLKISLEQPELNLFDKCNEALLKVLSTSRQQVYECMICGTKVKTLKKLSKHQSTHIERFMCSFCELGFTQRSLLIKHERTHTGEKPYECPFCLQRFSLISNLNRHKIVHRNSCDSS